MQLLFASSNKNKIAEINAIVPTHLSVIGLSDIGITEDIPETGTTIAENSKLKAQYVTDFLARNDLQMPVFADDSGLEVKALKGAPGVYSARYAGTPKSDAANNTKLLNELKNVTDRKARFVTVITLMSVSGTHVFTGTINGTIAYEPRGSNGFGYDPLFIPQGYRSTFAELSRETKNSISHRALAVNQLVTFLTGLRA